MLQFPAVVPYFDWSTQFTAGLQKAERWLQSIAVLPSSNWSNVCDGLIIRWSEWIKQSWW